MIVTSKECQQLVRTKQVNITADSNIDLAAGSSRGDCEGDLHVRIATANVL